MKRIKLDFLPVDVIFIVGRKKYNKYVNKKGYMDSEMSGDAVTLSVTGAFHNIVIGIDHKSSTRVIEVQALLIHELSHAVSMIFETHGFNCDELRSYLIQHLYAEVIPLLNKHTNK